MLKKEKMQNFCILHFVRMNSLLITVIVVLVVSTLVILLFRWQRGFYPGSKLIVEDTPVEINGVEPTQAKFYFFYTTWCPWSKKAWKPWASFKQMLKDTPSQYGGYDILLEEVNAEADKGKAGLYRINAYPSFKLVTQKKVYTMKGVPDPLAFDAFLQSALGEKVPHNTSTS